MTTKCTFFAALLMAAALATGCATNKPTTNNNFIWIDCHANFARTSSPDSIQFYLQKIKDTGFDNVVVDMKPIDGDVLYSSEIAPQLLRYGRTRRDKDYDMLSYFLEYGHELGMNIYASMNIFCGGNNWSNRGIIFKDKAHMQSIVYTPEGLKPIGEVKSNYNGMLNPVNPEVQEYELSILKEFVSRYKDLDGIIFDRLRFDGITADFSEISRSKYEEHVGHKVENFPTDIIYYEDNQIKQGKEFKHWIEWRSGVIKDYLAVVRKELKAINPELVIGDYTGAWYPTYYNEGLNWASDKYDPSTYFDWALPTYKDTGYASLLDVYMPGLYYVTVSKSDVDRNLAQLAKDPQVQIEGVWSPIDMKYARDYWYCIEGGAEWVNKITAGDVPVYGTILVSQYNGDSEHFTKAAVAAREHTDGLVLFDLCHIIADDLWAPLKEAIKGGAE